MPRPKAADPVTVDFHVRTTRAEAEALDAVIARWADDMRAQGMPVSADKTGWFRALVRREAHGKGITVNDPPSAFAAPSKPSDDDKPKRAKRGK